ncbi:MAG TPA: helix-turn-helix domain-containing GNAT family N-acetyltransferase [Negativicutes bacterium]
MDKITELRALEIRKFNRFYTNIIGLVNQTILESPYSLAEARVLLEIDGDKQCTASDLTTLLKIDPGYLSRMLGRFSKEQLVIKSKSLADGRAQVLSLTNKGRETVQQLYDSSTYQIAKLLECLPNSRQQRLVSCMEAIQNILTLQEDTSVIIRPYMAGDLGYIAHRHVVLYEAEYGLDKVFEQYIFDGMTEFMKNQSQGNIWIAEVGGQIVGSIAIVDVDSSTAQLRWFLTEPEFRGMGLGRQLMNIAMEYCKQRKYKNVFLWTFQGLDAARHLYRRFGFEPTEQVENNTWRNKLVEERWDITLNE